MNHQIDLLAICPFYINLLLEGLEDFQIIGKVRQAKYFHSTRETFAGWQDHQAGQGDAHSQVNLSMALVIASHDPGASHENKLSLFNIHQLF